jgi:molybdenum cofactor synthesis domain-containing protein
VAACGYIQAGRTLVSDDRGEIVRALLAWADGGTVDLILTTGGTGLTPTDHTPEVTRKLLDREVPGIAEAIRNQGVANGVPTAALSRGLAGVTGNCLIVNLPGSKGGVKDGHSVLDPVLRHAVEQAVGSDQ